MIYSPQYEADLVKTTEELLEWGCGTLQNAGMTSSRLDARLLLQHVAGVSRETLLFGDAPEMTHKQIARYEAAIARRAQSEPVAKIIGEKEFWNASFLTNQHTLDPRPDSESLIEAILECRPDQSKAWTFLDLGTGTGCLLLSLLEEYPKASGIGVDVSDKAIEIARKNVERLGLKDRTRLDCSHWTEGVDVLCDVIISNPPYIPEADRKMLAKDVAEYDPEGALFAGDDGLDAYREMIPQAARVLASDGILVIEAGAGQADAIVALGRDAELELCMIKQDLGGIARAVVLQHCNDTKCN